MQWNFFLSKHWSVFGEPGFALEYATWGSCPGYYVDRNGNPHNYLCPNGPNHLTFDPFILFDKKMLSQIVPEGKPVAQIRTRFPLPPFGQLLFGKVGEL